MDPSIKDNNMNDYDDLYTFSSPIRNQDLPSQDHSWDFSIGFSTSGTKNLSNTENNLIKYSDSDPFSFTTDSDKSPLISPSTSIKFQNKKKKLPGKLFHPFVSLETQEYIVHQLRSEIIMQKLSQK